MRRLVGAALLVAALAAPEVAHAGFSGDFNPGTGVLTLTGTGGNDQVTVAHDGSGNITVVDENGPVTITGGTPNFTSTGLIQIFALEGDDMATVGTSLNGGGPPEPGQAEIEVAFLGGPGNDTSVYLGGPFADFFSLGMLAGGDAGLDANSDGDGDDLRTDADTIQLNGGAGNDNVRGTGGTPFNAPFNRTLVINGGPDNDLIDGGIGMSILNGDEGNDNIGIVGGNNTVNGGPGMNTGFVGFGGMLTLNQNAGVIGVSGSTVNGNLSQLNDLIAFGSNGNDTFNAPTVGIPLLVDGFGGNDTITTGMAGDQVGGGPGNDNIRAGDGDDDLFGDQGDDELRGQGGTDNVNGGDGNDSCEGETQTSCEILIVDPVPNPGGGTQPPGTNNPTNPLPVFNPFADGALLRGFTRTLGNRGIEAILGANGTIIVFDGQPGLYDFSLLTQLNLIFDPQSAGPSQRRKQIVLAKATKRVTTAGRVRVKVKLTRQGRRVLRRARRVRTTFRARYTSLGGDRYSASRKVTLKRKRR